MVSVIIPNYNHTSFLEDRINSVLSQTYEDYEIIILDDHSTDNSRIIIEGYRSNPKISSIIYNDINSGSTFCQWNKGIALAKGDIIWIAESDDVADKDFLKNLVPYFKADTNLGVAYCQSYRYDSNSNITGNWKAWTDDLDGVAFNNEIMMAGSVFISKYLLYKNTIPNASAVLFSKNVYQEIGGADPSIKYCSDWLTWLKMLTVSNIVYSPQLLNYFRYHENSVIATAAKNPGDIYIHRFGRIMRENFHEYFKGDLAQKKYSKDIYFRNWNFIVNEYEQEGLFELHRKKIYKGWINIFHAAFSRGVNLKIILRALREMRKTYYPCN